MVATGVTWLASRQRPLAGWVLRLRLSLNLVLL